MIKAVLDTNTIVSALIKPNGRPAQILAQRHRFQIVLSEPILQEVMRVLHYPRIRNKYPFTEEEFILFYANLAGVSELAVVEQLKNAVPRDPSDNPVVATAKAGHSDYIVSGDQDLTSLKEYEGIQIVTPAQFLDILARPDEPSQPLDCAESGA